MKEVAGYIRVFSKTKAMQGESLKTQRNAIEGYVKSHG